MRAHPPLLLPPVPLLLLLSALAAVSVLAAPEQIHLSLTGSDSTMAVDFVWPTAEDLFVCFREKPANSEGAETETKCQPTMKLYQEQIGYLHNTEMGPLTLTCAHEYQVRVDQSKEETTWIPFTTPPFVREGGEVAAVFADFGIQNDVSMRFITNDTGFDYMLHVGDFAYDLNDENSTVGNRFMNEIGMSAQSIPYMPAVGNHELHDDDAASNSQYNNRFRGVAEAAGRRSGSDSNYYYSFNRGLIHYVVINTEIYHFPDSVARSPLPHTPEEQLEWLQQDLARVDRSLTPWVVAMGHKGWYMSSFGNAGWEKEEGGTPETNWTAFESHFCSGGVDLYLTGHVHLYQRFYPLHSSDSLDLLARPKDIDTDCVSEDGHRYENPRWMSTVTVASPGDKEIGARLECVGLEGVLYRKATAVCTAEYGYGHLQALNSSHLYFEFYQTGIAPSVRDIQAGSSTPLQEKRLRDHLWLVMDSHGPRDTC